MGLRVLVLERVIVCKTAIIQEVQAKVGYVCNQPAVTC